MPLRTRWIMRSLHKNHTWETAGEYTPEQVNQFQCAKPVKPIWNDRDRPSTAGEVGMGRCELSGGIRRVSRNPSY